MFRKDKNKGVKASQAEDYKLRKEGRKEIQNSQFLVTQSCDYRGHSGLCLVGCNCSLQSFR